jgi:hypothetical protein
MENRSPCEGRQTQKPCHNICNTCGREFVTSFRHPHQKYCKHPQCIRKRNAVRKKNNTKLLLKNTKYLSQTSQRKHEEYMRRKARNAQVRSSNGEPMPPYQAVTARNLNVYFIGLISYATGTTDASELERLQGRCYEIGKNVNWPSDSVTAVR